jgi:hypothetical protein
MIPALSENAPPIAAKAIGVDMRMAATKVLTLKITLRISVIISLVPTVPHSVD